MNDLRPGVELNRAIAEEVMGWKEKFLPDPSGKRSYDEYYYEEPRSGVSQGYTYNWNPSSDISQAFRVAEWMWEQGFRLNLARLGSGEWQASFSGVLRYHNSPATAICLAALRDARELKSQKKNSVK